MSDLIKFLRHFSRITFLLLFVAAAVLSLGAVDNVPAVEMTWDKMNHAMGYFLLIGLLDFGFAAGRWMPAKGMLVFGYGLSLEFFQFFLPYRQFSYPDIAANAIGVGAFLILRIILIRTSVYRALQEAG